MSCTLMVLMLSLYPKRAGEQLDCVDLKPHMAPKGIDLDNSIS